MAVVFDYANEASRYEITAYGVIDRRNGGLVKVGDINRYLIPGEKSIKIHCILGMLSLLSGSYIVVASESKVVSKVLNVPVYQITAVELVKLTKRDLTSKSEIESEIQFISSTKSLLGDGSFYYSPGFDLTSCCQKKAIQEEDPRFDWTFKMRELFTKTIKADKHTPLVQWCFPVIRGFVSQTHELKVGEMDLIYVLISRIGRDRAGRRFITRGANKSGHVVNFVETEQLFYSPREETGFSRETPGTLTSFVQVRGSIPILWSQKPNLNWDPPIKIKPNTSEEQFSALKNHFDDQVKHYHNQTVVSLIKLKGSESELGKNFTKFVKEKTDKDLEFGAARVNYIQFDLHNEVGLSKIQNLEKLFKETDNFLNEYGIFCVKNKDVHLQSGTLRTNCKDNLDRTNLVQTRFAIKAAQKQLEVLLSTNNLNPAEFKQVESVMRLVWADNGDALSIAYAGTGAMRSDHTRTGKTTTKGLLNDALGAVTRYYINNFEDGKNQDAIDLVTLKKIPEVPKKHGSPTAQKINFVWNFLNQFFTLIFKSIQPLRLNGLFGSHIGVLLCFIWMFWVFFFWKVLRLDPNRIIDLPKLHTKKKDPAPTPAQEPNYSKKDI
uniref:SAC domain-containing protein n=1 Tax=Arcella intermedia TaxID=1963864 RepID=A0A6B2KZX6_9EUKA|eukprot:TRINITY_DN5428_c0_g1_i1.p1 TRINITY_DN5428_c0_g1~~TRINITY_DN5428_c0_g1_i1.p1  ORF type:complete len:669 (-),score=147.56 TRINITY_DN5428_c0_g1_i1:15-1835(-)